MFGSLGEKCYLRGVDGERYSRTPHLNTKTIFIIYGQILKRMNDFPLPSIRAVIAKF